MDARPDDRATFAGTVAQHNDTVVTLTVRGTLSTRALAARRPAVFLDRDGVLNMRRPTHVRTWAEFVFLPRALDALSRLATLTVPVVLITNQSVIGRGDVAAGVIEEIHRRMQAEITAAGGPELAIYVCPHKPSDGCYCRKPNPGLLLQAADDRCVDLSSSIFVGDSLTDVAAASRAGCRAIYIGNEDSRIALCQWATVACLVDLSEAVDWILHDPTFAKQWGR